MQIAGGDAALAKRDGRKQQDEQRQTERAFTVRIIRFSLGLAEASRRREQFPRQIAEVLTEVVGPI